MLSSVYEGLHILLNNGVQEHLGNHGVAARLEGEGDGEVYQASIRVFALGWVKFPHSFEVVEYSDIFTDGRYEERFHKIDVTGVSEIEEWLEPNNQVCGQFAVFVQGHCGLSTVRNKFVIFFHVRNH